MADDTEVLFSKKRTKRSQEEGDGQVVPSLLDLNLTHMVYKKQKLEYPKQG